LVAYYRVNVTYLTYIFQTLRADPQEALQKRHLLYCLPGLECFTPILVQPTDVTRMQYTKCRLCSAS
jgi:hypothetical protein